jgi:integrase
MASKKPGKKIRGVIYRRGSWWCRWFENGRERWEACDSKTQAAIRYGWHRANVREQKFFPEKFAVKDITLSAWMKRCVEGSTNIGKGNEARYARRWSLWFGKRLLSAVSTEDLRHHQAKMRAKLKTDRKTKQQRRQWADATINRHFAFLRRAFTLAIKDNKLARNPVSGIKFFPEQHRTRFLSEQELVSLRNVLNPEAWSWVCLAVETGMRQAEQFALRWKHVDFENGVATIPMSKSGKTRHVSLSDGATSILRRVESFTRSVFVFPSVHDPLKPLCPDSFLRNIFRPALKRAGIQGACWHSLRHTAASRRVMAGVDLLAVKELLGHQDFDTTLKYSHLSPKHLRESVNLGSLAGLIHTVARTVAQEEGPEAGYVQPVDFVVRPEGLEPPTPRSVVWCSIH